MTASTGGLYSLDILRLATATVDYPRLDEPEATATRRTRTCGSAITVDVRIGAADRITAIGFDVRACAVGQAAATLAGRAAIGRTTREVADLARDLRAYLTGAADRAPAIEGVEALAAVHAYPARHDAATLAFDALAAAVSRPERQPA